MIRNSITGPADTGKLIYGSEVLLIIFAAFLLAAAIPPKTTNAIAVPVKVNMPSPQAVTEPTNTAMIQVNDETQTTAFLAIEAQTPKQTTP